MPLKYLNKIIPLILLSACAVQSAGASDDIDDRDTRLNPNFEDNTRSDAKESLKYSFINYAANRIEMNGHSWNKLKSKLESIGEGHIVNIVHIGDSHIQAEGNTSHVRKNLQASYGDAGRGLIIPFRLAGTNQPLDYRISSSASMTSAKLLKTPWPTKMGFTGISLQAPRSCFDVTITNEKPFSLLTVLGSGKIHIRTITSNGEVIGFRQYSTYSGQVAELDKSVSSATISIDAPDANIFGFNLRNEKSGIIYSAIGNNGAAFSSYSQIPHFGHELNALKPDLVIISLGTNEAFGKISDYTFYNCIKTLVDDIRQNNPGVEILLTTPSECQRSTYKTIRTGKKRRRRTRRIRQFEVNHNVARLADVIRRFGRENHIPVYDFYAVAGGNGASEKWVSNRMLSGDRIHRTWAGYKLEGELLSRALAKSLDAPKSSASVQVIPIGVHSNETDNAEALVNNSFARSTDNRQNVSSSDSKNNSKVKNKKTNIKTTKSSKNKSKKSAKSKKKRTKKTKSRRRR